MALFMLEDHVLKAVLFAFFVLGGLWWGLNLLEKIADTMTRPANHMAWAMARRGLGRLARWLLDLARPRPPRIREGWFVGRVVFAAMGLVFLVLAITLALNGLIVMAALIAATLNQTASLPLTLLAVGFFWACCACTRIIWLQGWADLREAMRPGGTPPGSLPR